MSVIGQIKSNIRLFLFCMNEAFKENKTWALFSIKTTVLCLLILLSILRLKKEEKPYPTGDAIEYTLMTEAFFNHFSPEVKVSDYESFKQTFIRTNKWEENEKATYFDAVGAFLQKKDLKNLDYNYAFFVDKQGRKYSAHFWFYSLLNLPARYLCAIIPFNPILVFHITNLLLIVVSCFVFLFNELLVLLLAPPRSIYRLFFIHWTVAVFSRKTVYRNFADSNCSDAKSAACNTTCNSISCGAF